VAAWNPAPDPLPLTVMKPLLNGAHRIDCAATRTKASGGGRARAWPGAIFRAPVWPGPFRALSFSGWFVRSRGIFMLEAGAQPIPGHCLTRRLGMGSFSEVWEAVPPAGDRIALKFLDSRSRYGYMIRGEVRVLQALSGLHHPGFIRFHGVHACGRWI